MHESSLGHSPQHRRAPLIVALAALALGSAPRRRAPAPADSSPVTFAADTPRTRTRVWMRNVAFHMKDSVVLRIHALAGTMLPIRSGPVDFDDPSSYVTEIASAQVGMTGPDLTRLMNRHVFAYPGAPLSNIRIELLHGELRQTGTLHKGVPIPFDMRAQVRLTPEGQIQLHPTSIRIFGVNGEALMKALHLSLAKMIDLSHAHGVSVKGDDLFLDPMAVLPPPAIRGRLTRIQFSGDELLQVFGDSASDPAADVPTLPDPGIGNYMYYRGGSLHFGKLTMQDAEMLVVDLDPRTPFDFDNDHYQRQLIAGHSRTLPSLGLEVYMPDAGAVGAGSDERQRGRPARGATSPGTGSEPEGAGGPPAGAPRE